MAEKSFLEKDFPNIWDYLYSYGNTSFQHLSFNDADNLVLACLAYIPWEQFEKPGRYFRPLPLKEAVVDFFAWLRPDFLLNHYPDWCKKQLIVASALLKSRRFSSCRRTALGFELSLNDSTQFGAFALEIDEHTRAVAFRGTDNSILGWKESLSLAIYPSVSGQIAAAKFLKKQMDKNPDKRFIVLGHSKGGNLAVYASSMLSQEDAKRIIHVYSDDGPGLAKEIYESKGHLRIQPKIIHIVPECDVVGSLLLHEEITKIVKSAPKGDFLFQHDLCNWHLKADSLYHLDLAPSLDKQSQLFADSVNELLETKLQKKEERERLVDGLINTIYDANVTEASQILNNPYGFRMKFLLQYPKQKKEEKKAMRNARGDLIRIVQKNWIASRSKQEKTKEEPIAIPRKEGL